MVALLLLATVIDLSAIIRQEVAGGCEDGASASDRIVVCGVRRHSGKTGPYRITIPDDGFDVKGNARSVASERSRWVSGGASGTGSCSAVGPGGWTGCLVQGWRQQRQQRGGYN